jgi:hypothetical protein
LCCEEHDSCDKVCRNNPNFADRVREVQTFALSTIPKAEILATPSLPSTIPMVFHKSRRKEPAPFRAAALPLAGMFNRKDGSPRHRSHLELCDAFGIQPGRLIVLSGTDHDAPIERWWGLGEERRRRLIRNLIEIGVAFTTTPNYSLFIDSPRWDDLHAMKRIAIVHHEFVTEGLPAGLHVNGRTETDFRRWTDHVATHPEISHLAYEFTTGTGWAGRREIHAAWLCQLAQAVGRPLSLVLRGGAEMLPMLGAHFAQVSLLETSSFMKAMMRKRAVLNGTLSWSDAPSDHGAPIDDLFSHNVNTVDAWVSERLMRQRFAV